MSGFITPDDLKEEYDVIVVGSGAAGGVSAHELSQKGLKVLMLEAGRNYDPEEETQMFETPVDAKLRDALYVPGKSKGSFESAEGGWSLKGEPYFVENAKSYRPDQKSKAPLVEADDILFDPKFRDNPKDQSFSWYRTRMLGGRTNHWGRTSLRFGEHDFKGYSFDGQGADWPLSYEEVKPYYDRADQLVGILGTKENLENNPDSDYFLKPPKPRAMDLIFKHAGKKMGMPVVPKRAAILTSPLNDRSPCVYATECRRGCVLGAAFQSPTALINPAIDTENLDVITDAMAYKITIGKDGLANGIEFVDKAKSAEANQTVMIHAKAKHIILGAGSVESVRILFNSKIGNSSGNLGKWIMGSTGAFLGRAQLPALENLPAHNEDGLSISHAYSPWVKWKELQSGKLGFHRGYYITWNGGRKMPNYKELKNLLKVKKNTYGVQLKEDAKRYFGSLFSFYTPGEMLPNDDSYCEINPKKTDQWGIPVLNIRFKMGEQEHAQMKHKVEHIAEFLDTAGGHFLNGGNKNPELSPGGADRHEVGGARMSTDPKNGVTNSWGQVWDCKNVSVADGAVFASSTYKNPTLTIMALALRVSEAILKKI